MLYLIPTFISENNKVIPEEVLIVARRIKEFIVENEKSARSFLKSINSIHKQSDFIFHILDEHTKTDEIKELIKILKKDTEIGLMSEAGCPGIADPGAEVVRLAHKNNIKVVPLTGPSSILLALMGSGLNGQSFVFHGYLPRENDKRKNKLLSLEKDAKNKNQTQIFIETPYRNNHIIDDVLNVCNDQTLFCIALNLTSEKEFIKTMSVAEWKKQKPLLEKAPAIFLLL